MINTQVNTVDNKQKLWIKEWTNDCSHCDGGETYEQLYVRADTLEQAKKKMEREGGYEETIREVSKTSSNSLRVCVISDCSISPF